MDTNELFQAYGERWNAQDASGIVAYFADDDCVYEDAALGRVNVGKAQIEEFLRETFTAIPDFHLEIHDLVVAGDRFANQWTMSGTDHGMVPGLPATKQRFSVRGASVGTLAGERLVRNSDYWNLADVLVQIGILPAPE